MVVTHSITPNWLGSEVGMVLKTITVPATATSVTENGRKIVKSGTLIEDSTLGKVLLYNDADVTDGAVVKSALYAGYYIDANLPASVSTSKDNLAAHGLYAIAEPATTIAY